MATAALTDFGACTEFITELLDNRLIDENQLKRLEACFKTSPLDKPQAVADWLVEQKVLTRFQADAALLGRIKDLVLSNFRLTDILGTGSMGTVYKARSINDPGWYAIKIVPRRNVVSLTAVVEKVRTLKDIRHPRVSALIQIGAQGDRVYLAWPCIEEGTKLDEYVKKHGKLSGLQVMQIGSQVASGLLPYHEQGLFHGLLKPSDILVGADRRVRLLDFGVGFLLACERGKSLLDTMTNTKALARGLDCAAPETHLNPLDRTPAGDRYSLGCILYFCLTGRFPFPVENPLQKMLAHQTEAPPPILEHNTECPPRLAALVNKLLSKAPDDRFESTEELVETFRQLSSGKVKFDATPRPKSGVLVKKSAAEPPAVEEDPPSEPPLVRSPTPPRTPAVARRSQPTPAEPDAPASLKGLVLTGLGIGVVLGGLLAWFLGR
jgi:serine/threonine protein kinase